MRIIVGLLGIGLLLWVGLVALMFVLAHTATNGAPQEAALAAIACFAIIAPYVGLRALEITTAHFSSPPKPVVVQAAPAAPPSPAQPTAPPKPPATV